MGLLMSSWVTAGGNDGTSRAPAQTGLLAGGRGAARGLGCGWRGFPWGGRDFQGGRRSLNNDGTRGGLSALTLPGARGPRHGLRTLGIMEQVLGGPGVWADRPPCPSTGGQPRVRGRAGFEWHGPLTHGLFFLKECESIFFFL